MMIQDAESRFSEWEKLLDANKLEELRQLLQEAPMVDVAEFLAVQPVDICIQLLLLFDQATQATLVGYFTTQLQLELHQRLPRRVLAEIFSHMHSEVRVDIYQKLNEKQRAQLLPFLPKQVRQDVITLSAYAHDTAGSIMSTDFATIQYGMKVHEALDKVRKDAPSKKMIYYLYVVDEDMRMCGFVLLKDLVMTDPHTSINEILHDNFIFGQVEDSCEAVVHKIEKYDLIALPILNDEQQLVGIVKYDDAMDVIRKEQADDLEHFVGIVSDEEEEDYLRTSGWRHFKKRITWMAGLFVTSFVSAYIIHRPQYQEMIRQMTVLALYMTTINDAGGNAGSQAAMVVIRALALDQVSIRHWFTIFFKELRVSLLLAICLGSLSFGKVLLFSSGSEEFMALGGIYHLAFIVSSALSLQIIVSTLLGAMFPLLVKQLGGDPALAASPVITTMVDITGHLIYFLVALWLLK